MAGNFLFFFKYYICVWSRRNIFIPSGKIFLLVYFVNLIFGNIVFFLSLLFFYYFAIVPFILNFEFWNREDSFLFFYIIMHVFSSLTKFYAIFN